MSLHIKYTTSTVGQVDTLHGNRKLITVANRPIPRLLSTSTAQDRQHM